MDRLTEFQKRMERVLGNDAPRFFQSLKDEPCRALRYRTDLLSRKDLEEILGDALGEPVPFTENGFYYP